MKSVHLYRLQIWCRIQKLEMTSTEELRGIVAGLTDIMKQQAAAQKATNEQITQLTEALITHGAPSVNIASNLLPLRLPALQLPQFLFDNATRDIVNQFCGNFHCIDSQFASRNPTRPVTSVMCWRMAKIRFCPWKR